MEISPLIKYITFQLNHASSIALSINESSDIENLHSFRVSIRKSRSLLKLFFKDKKKIEKKLSKIVKKTNSLRELDIFLQSFERLAYPSLFDTILIARKNYFQTLWTDKFIKKSIKTINAICDELLSTHIFYTNDDLIKITHEHYKESKKRFKAIKAQDSDEKLHKIRIHFKRSRYALDFLQKSDLSHENKKIIKCKKAQEYFGNIQDISNQLEWLKNFCMHSGDEKECLKLMEHRQKELDKLKQNHNIKGP